MLVTALVQALAAWTGGPALLLDVEGHGREDIGVPADLSRTMGWFTAIAPVVLALDPTCSPAQAVPAVAEQLSRIPNRGLDYGVLRYLSANDNVAQSLRARPQAEVRFNYLGQFDQVLPAASPFTLTRASSGPTRSPTGMRRYMLDVFGSIVGGQFHVDWTFSENLHRRATIERLAERFLQALRALIMHGQVSSGPTPSDFPLANLDHQQLAHILKQVGAKSSGEMR